MTMRRFFDLTVGFLAIVLGVGRFTGLASPCQAQDSDSGQKKGSSSIVEKVPLRFAGASDIVAILTGFDSSPLGQAQQQMFGQNLMGGGQGGGAFSEIGPDVHKVAFNVDNTIILSGPADQIAQLKEIIRLLDVAPRQVMIKTEFIQVSRSDFRNFGIDWQVSKANFHAASNSNVSGPVNVRFAPGDVAVALHHTLAASKRKQVTAPMVTTSNNVPAQIQVGRLIPVQLDNAVYPGNGTVVAGKQYAIANASSGMFVLPRINGDNSISLSVLPFVVHEAGQVRNPDGTTAPILMQQFIGPIQRRVGNGETTLIAGFATQDDGTNTRSIPFFSDLSQVGSPGKSTENHVDDTELLVFVTATIIPEHKSGSDH